MPRHQREIAQALDVIHAADVFGDSERVINGRFVCAGVHDGGGFNIFGGDARDLRRPFGSKFFDVFDIFVNACCFFGDELVSD